MKSDSYTLQQKACRTLLISYTDTFIIYSKATQTTGYPELVRASKNFINTCIYKRLPIRGAISHGELILGHDNKILMGKAFLESYEYGEDQNWIGLILGCPN